MKRPEVEIESQLEDLLGEGAVAWTGWDHYDISLEIYAARGVDIAVTPELRKLVLQDMGFGRCWINYPNGDEWYFADDHEGERAPRTHNNWERSSNYHDKCKHRPDVVNRAALPEAAGHGKPTELAATPLSSDSTATVTRQTATEESNGPSKDGTGGSAATPSVEVAAAIERVRDWLDHPLDYAPYKAISTVCAAASRAVGPPQTQAARDVLAERERQVTIEGWTPEHDDEHRFGSLQIAAACLCVDGTDAEVMWDDEHADVWGLAAKHHGNWRRQLVIAGALVLAAIERTDRRDAAEAAPGGRDK